MGVYQQLHYIPVIPSLQAKICKVAFATLRLPGIPALAAPIHRLAASGEAPDEAVATGAGGNGGRATTGAGKGLVFFVEASCFNLIYSEDFF